MKSLITAINTEKYILENKNEAFYMSEIERLLKQSGYSSKEEYVIEKRDYLFGQWIPEVYYIDIAEFAEVTENAINNNEYGIYIQTENGVHAFHGTDEIDYDLCEELGVQVVELNYEGGTIIGSMKDLSILIIFPAFMEMKHSIIINKFKEILDKYIEGITINGNDILLNGDKISGSMIRQVGNSFVWAAQVSFADYSEYIEKICNKPTIKTPAYIDNFLITRNELEKEICLWLRKGEEYEQYIAPEEPEVVIDEEKETYKEIIDILTGEK